MVVMRVGQVGPGHRLTGRFRFDLLAELGTNTVVVGADVVQTPGCQLVGIVKLQGSDQKRSDSIVFSRVAKKEGASRGKKKHKKQKTYMTNSVHLLF